MQNLATSTDRQVVAALLRALEGGPIVLELVPALADEGLAAAYRQDGSVELNPDASLVEQARGLVWALEALHQPFRPALRLIQGGATT